MPELPEVECLTRAVAKSLSGATLVRAQFLRKDLRDPIPIREFQAVLEGQQIRKFWRRSKYMIWDGDEHSGIFHLGMTGNMRLLESDKPHFNHTHAIFTFKSRDGGKQFLHFIDPRRFGRITCLPTAEIEAHKFFSSLGPEPLLTDGLGDYLFEKSRKRKTAIKTFIMDARILVGVGNIYASESLFRAHIRPGRAAGRVTRAEFESLASHIKKTLKQAIKAGGTTLRDFKSSDGEPGYFSISLNVYGRDGEPCNICKTPIKGIRQTGRSTYYCPTCQS